MRDAASVDSGHGDANAIVGAQHSRILNVPRVRRFRETLALPLRAGAFAAPMANVAAARPPAAARFRNSRRFGRDMIRSWQVVWRGRGGKGIMTPCGEIAHSSFQPNARGMSSGENSTSRSTGILPVAGEHGQSGRSRKTQAGCLCYQDACATAATSLESAVHHGRIKRREGGLRRPRRLRRRANGRGEVT